MTYEVDLLDGFSRLVVTISPQARQVITRTLAELGEYRLNSGYETGGWLLGLPNVRAVPPRVEASLATDFGSGHSEGPGGGAFLDLDQTDEAERSSGRLVCGSWHNHPDSRSWPVPSSADLVQWASIVKVNRLSAAAGVIATASAGGGWTVPLLCAWGVGRDASGRMTCQRATVA
ncbi:MAG TPA: Mov34/MPN/PAD-1 family protein [Gaiellaceae bacterium]|nr:Mov34/MPN/PAD-1 family protein [Gaiellaceae bacterium]